MSTKRSNGQRQGNTNGLDSAYQAESYYDGVVKLENYRHPLLGLRKGVGSQFPGGSIFS